MRSANHYVDSIERNNTTSEVDVFFIEEAQSCFDHERGIFFTRNKTEDAEIQVDKLPQKAQHFFLGPGGSRETKWKSITATKVLV